MVFQQKNAALPFDLVLNALKEEKCLYQHDIAARHPGTREECAGINTTPISPKIRPTPKMCPSLVFRGFGVGLEI